MTQNTNRLLLDDRPLIVLPTLARAVGLEESIILQQLHYWLLQSKNERDGRLWVYNSTKEWQEQFPFWSVDAIRRILNSLRTQGVVVTANYNKMAIDRTLWYTIEYANLDTMLRNLIDHSVNSPNGVCEFATPITRDYQKTTTENVVVVEGRTLADVFRTWSSITKGTFNSVDSDKVKDLIDTHGAEAVYQAMLDANEQGKRTLAYVNGILRNRQNGTEKPQQQAQTYHRKSKVEASLDAVRQYYAMKGEDDGED